MPQYQYTSINGLIGDHGVILYLSERMDDAGREEWRFVAVLPQIQPDLITVLMERKVSDD